MTDEKWLRDGLAGAVPEAPQVPGRATAARDEAARRRRRTTNAVLGGAVAVVAITGIGFVAFDRDDPEAPPSDEPTVAVDPPGPYDAPACPPAPRPGGIEPPDVPDPDAPAAIPDGATSVRLCQGVGTPIDVPDDALVTDPQSLADLVNALPTVENPDDQICTLELGPGYRLVFGYDDGSQFVASGQRYGCRNLVVGSSTRATSDRPWEAFIDGLRAQRRVLEPPSRAAAPSCGQAITSPLAAVSDINQAVYCASKGNQAPITPSELRVLLADIARNTSDRQVHNLCDLPRSIVTVTSWGDPLVFEGVCREFVYNDQTWAPGSEAQQILNELSGRAR